jgi:hypothetical protein
LSGVTIEQFISGNFQDYLRKAAACAPLAIQAFNIQPKEDFAIQQLIPLRRSKPN